MTQKLLYWEHYHSYPRVLSIFLMGKYKYSIRATSNFSNKQHILVSPVLWQIFFELLILCSSYNIYINPWCALMSNQLFLLSPLKDHLSYLGIKDRGISVLGFRLVLFLLHTPFLSSFFVYSWLESYLPIDDFQNTFYFIFYMSYAQLFPLSSWPLQLLN